MKVIRIEKSLMNRDETSIDKYMSDIKNIPLITAEQEQILAIRIKDGDKVAFNQLVMANLRFVITVAKKYQGLGIPLGELINEGNLGLIKAVDKFDITKGFKFISYAVWWIRQSILMYITMSGKLIKIPSDKNTLCSKIKKFQDEYEQNSQREPSSEEIANALNISHGDIVEMLDTMKPHYDLYYTKDDENPLIDYLENKDANDHDAWIEKESMAKKINTLLKKLPKLDKEIICALYGIGTELCHQETILERYNISEQKLNMIKKRSMDKMRLSINLYKEI